jgi:hypothetical protein
MTNLSAMKLTPALAFLVLASAGSAELLFYEPFAYPRGEDQLAASGAWRIDERALTSSWADIAPGSLGYTDAQGNTLRTRGEHVVLDAYEEATGTSNLRALDFSTVTSNTLWFSVLGQQIAGSNGRFFNLSFLGPDNMVQPSDSGTAKDEMFAIGLPSNQLPEYRWRVVDKALRTGWNSAISSADSRTLAFAVVKVELNVAAAAATPEVFDLERYTLWINPPLDVEPDPAQGLSFVSTSTDAPDWPTVSDIRLGAGHIANGFDPAGAIFDEIRIATTWAEVMPHYLPEATITALERLGDGRMRVVWVPQVGRTDRVQWSADGGEWITFPDSARTGQLLQTSTEFTAPAFAPDAAAIFFRLSRDP